MNTIDLHTAPCVLLDDSRPNGVAGTSYLFHSPEYIIQAESFNEVPDALEAIDHAVANGFYVAGWISYEVGYSFEPRLQKLGKNSAEEPLIWMMVTSHRKALRPNDVEALLHTSSRGNTKQYEAIFAHPELSEAAYNEAINDIHAYIEAGDVYQINFTFPLPLKVTGSRLELYKALRKNQPVPYGAYINTGNTEVLSFSPELFLERSGTELTSKPMKGTAARGKDIHEDQNVENFLKEDEKSKAENLMIVDLIRNDLSRIATPGSVDVPKLFETEKYRTLFQMTSTVTATATDNLSPSGAIKAMFPCGSVTGAPKVRAMEVISELETHPRGIYCGTIGCFHKENWSLNVPIRTLVLNGSHAGRLSVGSGIVADSNSEGEYQECLLKARFTNQTPNQFALLESLLVEDQECQQLDLHMQRLADSAQYFGFAFPKDTIEEALHTHASLLEGTHKLRLLIDIEGAYSISSDFITDSTIKSGVICLSDIRTDSQDVFLRHKTTNRSLYNQEFKRAQSEGYLDALFLNEKGFVTEGAISNIFAEINGNLYTPPIADGLLPGIKRADLIRSNKVSLRSLTLDDLQSADSLYIGNAVRGLRKVTLRLP